MNQAFRSEWDKAGYGTKMGSAAVTRPPAADFIRLYHLTKAEHAISNIENHRLKVARLADLNDPFELLAMNFKEKPVRTVVREFKASYGGHTGLLCFSANWTDPVLWSHYADRHRGVCLGFDVPRHRVQKVDYASERILPNLGDETRPFQLAPAQQKGLLRTKFRHWEYETEYRAFVRFDDAIVDSDLHFCAFGPDLTLREVIAGPQYVGDVRKLRARARRLHPESIIFQARLAFKFFSVVPDERSVPSSGAVTPAKAGNAR